MTRAYGPHRPDDAPATVTIYGTGRWPKLQLVQLAPALVRQRRQLNQRAYEAGAR